MRGIGSKSLHRRRTWARPGGSSRSPVVSRAVWEPYATGRQDVDEPCAVQPGALAGEPDKLQYVVVPKNHCMCDRTRVHMLLCDRTKFYVPPVRSHEVRCICVCRGDVIRLNLARSPCGQTGQTTVRATKFLDIGAFVLARNPDVSVSVPEWAKRLISYRATELETVEAYGPGEHSCAHMHRAFALRSISADTQIRTCPFSNAAERETFAHACIPLPLLRTHSAKMACAL